jgi:hypothetical protein
MRINPVQKINRAEVPSYGTSSKILLLGSILGLGCGIVGANPAQAVSLNNSTGISNPATTITFSEVPLAQDTPLTNQYASLGVSFSGLYYHPSFTGSIPNISPPSAGNFISGFTGVINPFTISFSQIQSRAAFALATGTNPSTTFEALLNNTVVDSFTAATDEQNTSNFYGFTGVNFDTIRINTTGVNGSLALIDNIQFGSAATAVPEPFTVIGTLIGGTAAVRMRKKLAARTK